MAYEIITSKQFDKNYKKLSNEDRTLVKSVITKLASGEKLDRKFRDHKLQGKLKGLRDCHVKLDLVLI